MCVGEWERRGDAGSARGAGGVGMTRAEEGQQQPASHWQHLTCKRDNLKACRV